MILWQGGGCRRGPWRHGQPSIGSRDRKRAGRHHAQKARIHRGGAALHGGRSDAGHLSRAHLQTQTCRSAGKKTFFVFFFFFLDTFYSFALRKFVVVHFSE
jgi:hypothetical protein